MRFSNLSRIWILCIGGLIGGPSIQALTWTSTFHEVTTVVGAGELVARYEYKNEGQTVVRIKQLSSSCGCSTPTVDREVIASGETGILSVVYKPGDRVGPQISRLTVVTDEPGEKPLTLTLQVNILSVVDCQPKLLRWKRGAVPMEQTIQLKPTVPGAEVISVQSLDGKIDVAWSAKREAEQSWELSLKPKSTDEFYTGKVEIRVRANGHESTLVVFGLVR